MRRVTFPKTVCASVLSTLVAMFFLASFTSAETLDSVRQADHAFRQAFEKKDQSALDHLLDAEFIWIDANGHKLARTEVLQNPPSVANADVKSQSRVYGDSAVVRVNRGRMNVLRVWVKRRDGWRVALYQEVLQVEKSEPPGGKPSVECVNPCKTIPYQPNTQSEKEAIASWQGVMKAMARNDANAYSPLIADEFTATDTYHDRPYTKADRISQIAEQKQSGKRSAPPELLNAEMFDFGVTVLMVAREQRPGGKAYFNTRAWVARDSRWQMLFSFNTRIE